MHCGIRAPWAAVAMLIVALTVGCAAEPAQFHLNHEGDQLKDLRPEQREFLSTALYAMFGSPDDPYVTPNMNLNLAKLKMAAGPVWSDEKGRKHGLFRLHCVHCHGVTGDGAGPTAAFLNPHPRDFRAGIFKFKSTGTNDKPTDSDLDRTLKDGIIGTAMPSFALLPQDEIDALVEYVKYLSLRGETEKMIVLKLIDEDADSIDSAELMGDDILGLVMGGWTDVDDKVIIPPDRPEGVSLEESIANGAILFQNRKRAQCVTCHGPSGLGDGGQLIYDKWNEEHAKNPDRYYTMPLQPVKPRNLRLGQYRGGRRPVDLYRRIHAGISASGMPSFDKALQPDEIWALVDYVRSLPYEPSTATPYEEASYTRLRP